jgi:hypothetical protein
MSFKEFLQETKVPKEIAKLNKIKQVNTTKNTKTGWYSPDTTYLISNVKDGFYDKSPGITTKIDGQEKFIPLSDLDV